jgi:hypothetical protein
MNCIWVMTVVQLREVRCHPVVIVADLVEIRPPKNGLAAEQFKGDIGIASDEGFDFILRPDDIDANQFGEGPDLVNLAEFTFPVSPRVPQAD